MSDYNYKIIAILACDENFGIGKNSILKGKNSLPWDCKEDIDFFKKKTINNVVIMGKKTFETLNYKPLKNRINIVLTKDTEFIKMYSCNNSNIFFIKTGLNNALLFGKQFNKDIYIIGGKLLYEDTINNNLCDMIYINKIKGNYNCDVFLHLNLNNYILNYSYELSNNCISEEWVKIIQYN